MNASNSSAPRHAPQLGEREQRRRDRRGRMNDGRNVGVVEIERVGARRVQERRAQGIHAFASTDDGGLPALGKLGEGSQRDLHRPGAAARERHGEEIQQRPLGLVADRVRNVVPPRRDDEAGKVLRDAGSVQHGAVPNVAVNERNVARMRQPAKSGDAAMATPCADCPVESCAWTIGRP